MISSRKVIDQERDQEEEHATRDMEAPSRVEPARGADCEKDSQSQTVCVFARASTRTVQRSVAAGVGEPVSASRARTAPDCPSDAGTGAHFASLYGHLR